MNELVNDLIAHARLGEALIVLRHLNFDVKEIEVRLIELLFKRLKGNITDAERGIELVKMASAVLKMIENQSFMVKQDLLTQGMFEKLSEHIKCNDIQVSSQYIKAWCHVNSINSDALDSIMAENTQLKDVRICGRLNDKEIEEQKAAFKKRLFDFISQFYTPSV